MEQTKHMENKLHMYETNSLKRERNVVDVESFECLGWLIFPQSTHFYLLKLCHTCLNIFMQNVTFPGHVFHRVTQTPVSGGGEVRVRMVDGHK